jgi:hypothetical protein
MIVEQEDRMARRMSDREGVGVETGFVDDAGVPFGGNLGDGCRAFPSPRDVGGLSTRTTREGVVKTVPFAAVSERRYESSATTASAAV